MVTASATFHGHELKDIPVAQPRRLVRQSVADRDRRLVLAAVPVVEADSMQDAIDELADSEKYGHQIVVVRATLATTPKKAGTTARAVKYSISIT